MFWRKKEEGIAISFSSGYYKIILSNDAEFKRHVSDFKVYGETLYILDPFGDCVGAFPNFKGIIKDKEF